MLTVNGNELAWEEDMTVRGVLRAMNYNFHLLIIKVNGELVMPDKWKTFPVPDGAVVDVIHLITGG